MNKNTLWLFFNRELSGEEEADVLDWLDQSDVNKDIFEKERSYYNMIVLLGKDEKLAEEKPKKRSMTWLVELAKIAAVVTIMLSIGFVYKHRTESLLLASTNTISVPAGQHVNILLPDGSKVSMNSQSEIKYPSSFVGDERRVVLSGEAYFEVVHDAGKPFIVETQKCNIEVLGTTFNVDAYPNSDRFATSLIEGMVKISDNKNSQQQVTLKPNEQLELIDNKFIVSPIRNYELFQWREGLISFNDTRFDELMKLFEKYYGVQISIENKDFFSTELSGKIRINDGLDHALRVLQKNSRFHYQFDKDDDSKVYIK